MQFIDHATIFVRSGRGGAGCVSFRREKFVPKGGPDGGDGGRGGDVVLVGDRSLSTLQPLTPRPHHRAEHGQQGRGRQMHGADGAHRVVPVPLGTIVRDRETGEIVADILEAGERVIVAPGGRGGFGNEHFKSATNQTPRESTPGEPYVERTLVLELQLLADAGLVGLPNAGKSTFLSVVSAARPKVADYPFTTLRPHLGVVELSHDRRLVIADLPGLVSGASEGAGLGHDFLRHVERSGVMLHLVDIAPLDGGDPADAWRAIRTELEARSAALAERPEIIALTKLDLVPEAERAARIDEFARAVGRPVLAMSSATGEGVEAVKEAVWGRTSESRNVETSKWSEGA